MRGWSSGRRKGVLALATTLSLKRVVGRLFDLPVTAAGWSPAASTEPGVARHLPPARGASRHHDAEPTLAAIGVDPHGWVVALVRRMGDALALGVDVALDAATSPAATSADSDLLLGAPPRPRRRGRHAAVSDEGYSGFRCRPKLIPPGARQLLKLPKPGSSVGSLASPPAAITRAIAAGRSSTWKKTYI